MESKKLISEFELLLQPLRRLQLQRTPAPSTQQGFFFLSFQFCDLAKLATIHKKI
jgi:hypothetical protein